MIVLDQTVSDYSFHLTNWTRGESAIAQAIDRSAAESVDQLSAVYSLDDGRSKVESDLCDQAEECSEYGWDGYNAEPVSDASFRNAYRFVKSLPHAFPMPTVGAESDGQITLEWYVDRGRVISVSFGPDGMLHFAALMGENRTRNGRAAFLGEAPKTLLRLIRETLGL